MNNTDTPTYLNVLTNFPRKTRVITIGNEKGGVGKTSIIRLLPTALAALGFKCLIIDMDPQSNTTKSLFVTRKLHHEDEVIVFEKTLMKGISDGDLSNLIINVTENLDFIGSSTDLESFPTFLSKRFGLTEKTDPNYKEVKTAQYSYFKNLIDNVKNEYDFVFFDTPPTASDYTQAVAYASDYILIAFQTQSDSLDGANNYYQNTLTHLVNVLDANFEIIGILPNQLSKGSIDKKTLENAVTMFGEDNVFKNYIPFSKAIQNIPRNGIRKDGYWDKKMFEEIVEPIATEFLERILMFEGE